MKKLLQTAVLLQVVFLVVPTSMADVVLDKKTMRLTLTAAELSSLVYSSKPSSVGYDMLKSFIAEPDQALVAKKDGYCYGVFRGTTMTTEDWSQNLVVGKKDICGSDSIPTATVGSGSGSGEGGEPAVCCTVREGFYDAYHTNYYQDFETALRHCAKDCLEPDECVVLTGHSQGGAVAAVAAITLADLNPYVITFGQPPTIAPGCPYICSERWYRWVNTRDSDRVGIAYDPVPFVPGLGTECWGHFLVLGGNPAHGVAYFGLDDHRILLPADGLTIAHTIKAAANDTETMGYVDRIKALIAYHKNKTKSEADARDENQPAPPSASAKNGGGGVKSGIFKILERPIPTGGFSAGSLCSEDLECRSGICQAETGYSWYRCVGKDCQEDSDCLTDRCDYGECAPKLGSCQPCDEDSDCSSGKCYGAPLLRCTGPEELMDDNCFCILNDDCRSGRCEGVNPRICEAVLPMDARCNEDSDCASGYCSWSLRCADPSTKQTEIKVENKVLSWRTPVVIVAIIVLAYLVKYGIEYWFDTRAEYQQIADAELNNNGKKVES